MEPKRKDKTVIIKLNSKLKKKKKKSKKDKGPEIPSENLFPKLYLFGCPARIRVEKTQCNR